MLMGVTLAMTPNVDSEPTVKEQIDELGIEHPEVVYKQYVIESGKGTSNLAVKYNNLFGMKLAKNRPTTAIGVTKSGFAIYRSKRESIIDYALWQSSYARKLTKSEYLSLLGKMYAENPDYISKLTD